MGFWSFAYRILPDAWFNGISLRTYTGIMLISSIRARRRERSLRKALKRLKTKYTPDTIARLYEKYSSAKKLSAWRENRRIRKFQQKLDSFVTNFILDYQIFRAYYLDVLKLVSQSLISNKRESKREFTDVEMIFQEIESKKEQLIFPFREIEIFKGQLHTLLNDLMKDIRNDELSDIRVQKGSYPSSVSFLSFFSIKARWSRIKLFRKEKKQIKKLGKNLQFYDEFKSRIKNEIKSGQIQQDFLFLLIEFFKRVDEADARLEEIKQDLEIVIKKLEDEVKNVRQALTNILQLLRNEPQIKNNPTFSKIEQDISQLEAVTKQIVQQDFKNTEALRLNLQTVLEEGQSLLEQMERQSIKVAA